MLTDEQLAEIEARHHRTTDEGWDCASDGETYPCETARLLAEVKRLRADLMWWKRPERERSYILSQQRLLASYRNYHAD